MIDIIVAWMVLPTGPRFVAKKVLMYVPVVGLFMWVMGMVPIDRSNRHAAIAADLAADERLERLLEGRRDGCHCGHQLQEQGEHFSVSQRAQGRTAGVALLAPRSNPAALGASLGRLGGTDHCCSNRLQFKNFQNGCPEGVSLNRASLASVRICQESHGRKVRRLSRTRVRLVHADDTTPYGASPLPSEIAHIHQIT